MIAWFLAGAFVGALAAVLAMALVNVARKDEDPSDVLMTRLNDDEKRAKEERARRKAEEERQFDQLMQYKGVKQ